MKFLARLFAVLLVASSLAAITNAQSSLKELKEPSTPPVHVDDTQFAEALGHFQRLLNAIEIGTNLIDYRRELLDAKTALDPLLPDLPKSPQRNDFEEALRDYMVAADVWRTGIQLDGIPTKSDYYRWLRDRYELKQEPRLGLKLPHGPLLRYFWRVASIRIEHAIKVQKATA